MSRSFPRPSGRSRGRAAQMWTAAAPRRAGRVGRFIIRRIFVAVNAAVPAAAAAAVFNTGRLHYVALLVRYSVRFFVNHPWISVNDEGPNGKES